MDRDIGASEVATSSTDSTAYGDSYQWGRRADGHQLRTSTTTTTLSSTDAPGNGDLITSNTSPYDWRSPQNDNLWQGVSGTNNPCPAGFRLPTDTEWATGKASWSSNDATGAFNSSLKLVVGGARGTADGSFSGAEASGFYWSSSVNGYFSNYMLIGNYSGSASIGALTAPTA